MNLTSPAQTWDQTSIEVSACHPIRLGQRVSTLTCLNSGINSCNTPMSQKAQIIYLSFFLIDQYCENQRPSVGYAGDTLSSKVNLL